MRLRGSVKTMKREMGFAFLTHKATGDDYFMHRTGLTHPVDWADLEIDAEVEFTPIEGPKGLRAIEVNTL